MFFVPNIDNFLTIFLLSPKPPYLSAFLALLPFRPHPSPNPQYLPIYANFSTKSRTSFKMPKNPNYFLPDHTHSNRSNPKNPLKIKASSYFTAYPDHILPNGILLNHILTILFYKLSYNSRLLA